MGATKTAETRLEIAELKPPEAFDDRRGGPGGGASPTVESRLRMSCAGWKTVPTAEEFHRAVHDPEGRSRETAILLTWYHEAETIELAKAWLEGAYSWRQLARALHRVGLTRGEGARRVNRFAAARRRLRPTASGPSFPPGRLDAGRSCTANQPVLGDMTEDKRAELTLRGQPSRILARLRPAFKTHVRPHTENGRGERLGGGSILSAQWDHRLSRDLDIHLKLVGRENRREVLDRAAAACGGYRVEHPGFPRIEFERNKDNHIDVSLEPPAPGGGERVVIVDGEETSVLSNAQIMTGKLKGRGMTGPARDVFDVAVCRMADPEALEIAVNAVDDRTLDGILTVYGITRDEYKKEAEELEGVPEGLKPIREDPVGYANDAILESRYERFSLRIADGRAEIETRTVGRRERRRTYRSAEELVEGIERDGVNAFLEAQDRDARAVRSDAVDDLWMGRDSTIIVLEPPRLEHELLKPPRVDWNVGNEVAPRAAGREESPVRGKGRPLGGGSTPGPKRSENRRR